MFFLIKRKKVVVDAFTFKKSAHDCFPIDSANNFIPEWFKKTPKYTELNLTDDIPKVMGNTIRRCAGVIDYYNKNNLVIPLWSDFILENSARDYKFVFADTNSTLVHHEQEMRGEFMKSYTHFKLPSVWKLKEKSGVKFHFSQLFYNFEDPGEIILPPAIVNYKYQHSTEINFMLKRPAATKRYEFFAGQPLVLLTPLTEHDVEVKTHLIDEREYEKQFLSWIFSFHNAYNKMKKIQQNKESKCPFGFGK